ncbi:MAG: ABC transporter ATP-binding protein [Kiloniellales bacterium]
MTGSAGESAAAGRVAIEAREVTKVFGAGELAVHALDRVSVAIRENEFFTLLGPSGCGKTTLLRLIAGFELPSSGDILLDGQAIGHLPPFKRPVNTVFQSYALFPHMTVAQNVGFGLEMLGKSKAETRDTVAEMLALVKMGALAGRKTSQLSGGQQQRVALARALAPHPKVLLLDEPLSALDLKLRKEMQIELKRLQLETGITFVFVTHDQEEALTMSDRLAVMNQGEVLQVGTPRDIYERPSERFVANFIGETNFMEGDIVSVRDGTAAVRLASGMQIEAALPEGGAQTGRVTIVVRPEHSRLVAGADGAALSGRLENIVYFGTDTHYLVKLADGGQFTVRMQNTRGNDEVFEPGGAVGIQLGKNAAQVLRD